MKVTNLTETSIHNSGRALCDKSTCLLELIEGILYFIKLLNNCIAIFTTFRWALVIAVSVFYNGAGAVSVMCDVI